jgi:hypothetical protein
MAKVKRFSLKQSADVAANILRIYPLPPHLLPREVLKKLVVDMLSASQKLSRKDAERELILAEQRFKRYPQRYGAGLGAAPPPYVDELDGDVV